MLYQNQKPVFLGSAILLISFVCAAEAMAAFPEYTNQDTPNTFRRSAIMTSDRVKFWDGRFANDVETALGRTNYNEIAFAFLECFGGGMIDELTRLNNGNGLTPASYTSAASPAEVAWARSEDMASGADPNFPKLRRAESTYGLRYGPAAGGRAPMTQRAAAQTGYQNDLVGPNLCAASRQQWPTLLGCETPQYTATWDGETITLHGNNVRNPNPNRRYRAILFGGSTQADQGPALLVRPQPPLLYAMGVMLPANWNALSRMHDALLAAGYTEAEMYIMYPGGEFAAGDRRHVIFPGGPQLPAWVDAGARARDLEDAWRWLRRQTDGTTQVFFWSSWGHGAEGEDVQAKMRARNLPPPRRGVPFTFAMDADLALTMKNTYDYLNPNGGQGAAGSPDFEFTSTVPIPDPGMQVILNGVSLPLVDTVLDPFGDGSEYRYTYGLTRSDIEQLNSSGTQELELDFPPSLGESATFISEFGPTVGDLANGPSEAMPPQALACLPDTTAAAGQKTALAFCFQNTGDSAQKFHYHLADTRSWIVSSDFPLDNTVTLAADSGFCVTATIRPPQDCGGGGSDDLLWRVAPTSDPSSADSCTTVVTCSATTGVPEPVQTPGSFALRITGANPCGANRPIQWEYEVPPPGSDVVLGLYDASGRRVASLSTGYAAPGIHSGGITASDRKKLTSGIYFLEMNAGGWRKTRRIVVVQ